MLPSDAPGTGTDFATLYREYLHSEIQPLRADALDHLDKWTDHEYWEERKLDTQVAIATPVHRIAERIKRPESIIDKARRNPRHYREGITAANIADMHDIFGTRVIVYINSHIPLIDREIRGSGAFELHPHDRPKWYLAPQLIERLGLNEETFDITDRKASGYAGVHYILRPRAEKTHPWFELQLRTMLHDAWGEIEHKLVYKPDTSPEYSIRRQLRIMSDHLTAIDDHFDSVYERITYLQNQSNPQDQDILDETNLPRLYADSEIPLNQMEVAGLLSLLYDNNITRVGDFRARLTTATVQALKSVMARREPPKQLNAWHAASVAAAIHPDAHPDEAVAALKRQLELVELGKIRF